MESQAIAHLPMLPASDLGGFENPQGVESDRIKLVHDLAEPSCNLVEPLLREDEQVLRLVELFNYLDELYQSSVE